ncbi:MAG: hypothetical protein QOK10_2528 [Pseudonocardiales bacterium]|jgi:hypothetical protein|nr:hypothetical protein [Pseudonocardiales bacterium]
MQIEHYVAGVQEQLVAAAALGDERTREIAAALAVTAQASVRLALIDALSGAAAEVNAALFAAAGSQPAPAVTVGVEADTVRLSVSSPPADDDAPSRTDDGDTTARISFRLSEALKADIEDAAARANISVNTWLIRMAAASVRNEQNSSWPGNWPAGGSRSNRMTGWVTG